jgi:hypothetical protein
VLLNNAYVNVIGSSRLKILNSEKGREKVVEGKG